MWIEYDEIWGKLARADNAERDWLGDYLSFPDDAARFKGKSGKTSPILNPFSWQFPAGFLPLVRKAARDAGMKVEVFDRRRPPPTTDASADVAWLRDYQRDAFEAALRRERGILSIATGGGKTEIVVALARAVRGRWLLVVHRGDLARQAADRFRARNAEHNVFLAGSDGLINTAAQETTRRLGGVPDGEAGIIGEGCWREGESLTCATFQTLYAALGAPPDSAKHKLARDLLESVDGLIVDEAHTLPAESFYRVAMACRARYRIGLSGTPLERGDQKSVLAIGALGPVIYELKAKTLVESGVLARPKIRMQTVRQPDAPAATFAGAYNELVVKSAARNQAVVDIVRAAPKPCLVFVKQVEHGKRLEKLLWRAGVKCDFTWGAHSIDWRRGMISKLERADVEALICSVVFQEGVDIPSLRSGVNASGQMSVVATMQKLGRGMRVERLKDGTVAPGGDVFEWWDVFDEGNEWLEKHSRKRRNTYVKEGHETLVLPPTR